MMPQWWERSAQLEQGSDVRVPEKSVRTMVSQPLPRELSEPSSAPLEKEAACGREAGGGRASRSPTQPLLLQLPPHDGFSKIRSAGSRSGWTKEPRLQPPTEGGASPGGEEEPSSEAEVRQCAGWLGKRTEERAARSPGSSLAGSAIRWGRAPCQLRGGNACQALRPPERAIHSTGCGKLLSAESVHLPSQYRPQWAAAAAAAAPALRGFG